MESIYKKVFQVKETHLDFLGHMNHATYLSVLEQARWDLITENGYGVEEIKATGISPIVLDLHIKYKKELQLREKAEITIELHKVKSKIMVLLQKIIKNNGDLACEAQITIGLFDLKKRVLVEPTEKWKNALRPLKLK